MFNFKNAKYVSPSPTKEDKVKDDSTEKGTPVYQVGVTKDNRVTLSIGSVYATSLAMTKEGVESLITMLEAAKEAIGKDE